LFILHDAPQQLLPALAISHLPSLQHDLSFAMSLQQSFVQAILPSFMSQHLPSLLQLCAASPVELQQAQAALLSVVAGVAPVCATMLSANNMITNITAIAYFVFIKILIIRSLLPREFTSPDQTQAQASAICQRIVCECGNQPSDEGIRED
jgi:hypothetical protein